MYQKFADEYEAKAEAASEKPSKSKADKSNKTEEVDFKKIKTFMKKLS